VRAASSEALLKRAPTRASPAVRPGPAIVRVLPTVRAARNARLLVREPDTNIGKSTRLPAPVTPYTSPTSNGSRRGAS
jgi:hypothetical protein